MLSLLFLFLHSERDNSSPIYHINKKETERRQVNSKNEINHMIKGKNNEENIETAKLGNQVDQIEKANSGQSTVTECNSIDVTNSLKHNINSLNLQSNDGDDDDDNNDDGNMCHCVKSNSNLSNSINFKKSNVDQLSNENGENNCCEKNTFNNRIFYDEKEPIFRSFRSKLSTFESMSHTVGYVSPQLRKSQSAEKFNYELSDKNQAKAECQQQDQQNLERTRSNP